MRLKHIVLISFLGLVISEMLLSCAQIVAPTGGKKDTLAPVLVKVFPQNQSKNFNGKQIELQFDEYVSVDNIQQQLSITPNLEGTYETKILPKGARLTFDKPFKANTTYSFNFRNTFKDMNERNPAKNIRLVFSTGNIIDSLKVSGKVINPLDKKPMMDVSVGLYVYTDTLNPKKIKPYYFMKTDSSGKFNIENIAAGKYRIYAITDNNSNLLYDEAKELMGFVKDTIDLKNNVDNLEIKMAKMDKTLTKVLKSRNTANYYLIEYNRGIKNVKIDFNNQKDSLVYQQVDNRNIRIFNTINNSTDTIKVKISVTDSLERVFTHDQKVKFKVKSKKDDGVKDEFSMKIKPSNNEDIDLKEVGYAFTFTKPIKSFDLNKLVFENDTIVKVPITEKNISWNKERTEMKILVDAKKPKELVRVKMQKGTFISVENDTTNNALSIHPIRDVENYGTIAGEIKNPKKKNFIVQLLDEKYEVVQKLDNISKYEFTFVKAGIYYVRLIVDENRNARWDSGDVEKNILPEETQITKDKIKLKQNFELTGYDFTIE
ncbi:Ig-like domain-containing protein [Arcicella aurantiaca]|uniref:Ig-like domain-containing protein n=1 Tax=Arcicella aurantiaca TaxID=591202 RepID=A0A316DKR4_9BACT|nr:Ig-like domain-containing domain [Arcicella aurantiaca]PWK17849.1 Ig-like domain-containing protein [Arcicella aurantiaca]